MEIKEPITYGLYADEFLSDRLKSFEQWKINRNDPECQLAAFLLKDDFFYSRGEVREFWAYKGENYYLRHITFGVIQSRSSGEDLHLEWETI